MLLNKTNLINSDTLILVIGIIIARFFYSKIFDKFNIIYFLLLVLFIQIIHDFLFFKLIINPLPRGINYMIDFFKDYASEVGAGAILGDSIMITIAVLLSSIFANYNININILLIVLFVYLVPYILHAKE
jgi:hypothetical protein